MKQTPLVMPKMSMTMTEGVMVTWHKAEGDEIRAGDVVCEVTTDKVDMEVEATVEGTLARIVAQPEDVVAVGEPIAYVATTSDDLLEGLFDPVEPPIDEAAVAATPVPAEPEPVPAARPAVIAAVPAARRVAAERGIDLATVTPTGPAGTIRLSDLGPTETRPAIKPENKPEAKPALKPRRGPRAVIARRMSPSADVPQFVVYRDLDLVPSSQSWTAVFVRAFAQALRRHPELNGEWADGQLRQHEHIGVALAVDTERGLLAPVLKDPDLDDLGTLGERIADVVRRARAGKLTLAEMSGGTTTVSNLGMFGVDAFQALLSPPQATALSLGAVGHKVVPVPGGIGVALRCTAGLTVDHRVGDGADAARLLATLQQILSV
ncbi:dihydrolipoamide acetyltransferase family protein [Amycolatopsis taiwanensis]|uniref:Dihydrolipoamide acetyltransferase component of pyruvate dehydrogenase complex n=1 Tax=Amycolatopsis taiwanensis TaxID=342230 RepID=A0A9W6VLK9_9PSEU|nr:dihydrolipoamide acetyltransferase family protein [Amycolatopsis taiwanensis]GLY70626.1 dihydrolipoamide acetyltransferase component of pyruvate dehydrogenase complex [Amycolatopsis taiwanensis]